MPPTLKQRLLGIFVDYLIILLYIGVLLSTTLTISFLLTRHIVPMGSLNPWLGELIGFMTLTLPVSLYFIVTESSIRQASFGKQITHIIVTDRKGNKPTLKLIIIRTSVKLLPWELAHACIQHLVVANQPAHTINPFIMVGLTTSNILLFIYLITIIFRHDHIGPYDLVAGTKLFKRTGKSK